MLFLAFHFPKIGIHFCATRSKVLYRFFKDVLMSAFIAAAAAASNQAQVQMAVAAKIAKMNAGAERSVAQLLEASAKNMKAVVNNTAPGVGGVVDISV